ncbi:MAG: PEP-CTERM sorting domain-containing protein [Pseudomonadota bacterium]
MKKSIILLFSMAFFLFLSGVAGAVPTTWTDVIDYNPNQFINSDFTYTHNIADGLNGFQGYLMGGDDIILSYTLTLALYDNDRKSEAVLVDQPGWIGDDYYNFSYSNQDFGWSLAGILQLNAFGELTVTLDKLWGDFYLDFSELNAYGDNGSSSNAPVPEPATMILLGTGLVGLAGFSRKKLKK